LKQIWELLEMTKLRFRDLPMVARATSALSILTAWVCFEEFGIDRNHWDRFLPYYRVGKFCAYDTTMILLIAIFWIAMHRPKGADPRYLE